MSDTSLCRAQEARSSYPRRRPQRSRLHQPPRLLGLWSAKQELVVGPDRLASPFGIRRVLDEHPRNASLRRREARCSRSLPVFANTSLVHRHQQEQE